MSKEELIKKYNDHLVLLKLFDLEEMEDKQLQERLTDRRDLIEIFVSSLKVLDESKVEECKFIEKQYKEYDEFDRYSLHTTFTCNKCGFEIYNNPYCDTCRIHNYCPECGRKIIKK